ncbi:MAG: sulfite reductase [NADPH] flavoprotein alpha-component [Lysobacteraceae bacterium]|nr:MAG: sulfite reductase [NADPH] flavoprotein alpha-component [Xanthomonadaceae bacterium]
MAALPRLPELLPAENAEALGRAVAGLDAPALWWLSGYAAGLAHARSGGLPLPAAAPPSAGADPAPAPTAAALPRLTVVFGSQTGNARRAAEALAAEAEAAGFAVRLFRADAYPLRELGEERRMSFVFSTQGDGDPSDDAIAFLEHLEGRRAPRLESLRYAILALGDSSYPRFCAVGRRLDERLAALGARRLLDRAEADVDVEATAGPWRAALLGRLREEAAVAQAPVATVTPLRRATPTVSRERPFAAELLCNQRITGRDSDKDVRHLELDLSGSGLAWEPGDALGVRAENPPALVEAVLELTGLAAEQVVQCAGRSLPLRECLLRHREITRAGRGLLAAIAAAGAAPDLAAVLAEPARTAELLGALPLVGILRRWRRDWDAQALVDALPPLAPRLYSLASSRAEVGEEAHLTVDVVRYVQDGAIHVGAASSHLARLEAGARLEVFLEPNERFRLPADRGRDLIMIAAGTGIAPFRAFVQQRAAEGAGGRHWLLFGAPRLASDFLYQVEWLAARKDGRLARLDLAFSRDQERKVYVQHRIREQGRELLAWLRGGAHLYVCGAVRMGHAVHAALRDVLVQHAGLDAETAESELRALQVEGRYARDLYGNQGLPEAGGSPREGGS